MADNTVEGSELVMALSKALEGSASQWLSQVCYAGITWTQFKDLFTARFIGVETNAAVLLNVLHGRPKKGEGPAEYGTRIVTLLLSKWKSTNLEEIAVSLTLAHMAQLDDKLSRWIFTENVKSLNELQQQLHAHAFKKRNLDGETCATQEHKKPKLLNQMKCNFCGKVGHKYAECRSRLEKSKNMGRNHNGGTTAGPKDRAGIRCFKCDEPGHFASSCSKGRAGGSGQVYEKRVDICTIAPPSGVINLSGESVPFCFDSGAECSLVKESKADKFKGKRINNIVKLNGIGNDSICSIQQILANITIEQYCFEILLHVVLDRFLNYDVLIGREILGQGFGVLIDAARFQMYKTKEVKVVNKTGYEDIISSSSHINEHDKMTLINILKLYSDSFIDGIP
ncbi:uncharacterized protein LOC122756965 [Drosophila mojavensis]|uniref:uncharacterized protein LOC122756965 n=1 Tax=Drosophila mojavensis TaxID=7230 RepID=UPI001CD130DE|nr:uncharacterized protein LOC122756965 [Drosophila mojavensis]